MPSVLAYLSNNLSDYVGLIPSILAYLSNNLSDYVGLMPSVLAYRLEWAVAYSDDLCPYPRRP